MLLTLVDVIEVARRRAADKVRQLFVDARKPARGEHHG